MQLRLLTFFAFLLCLYCSCSVSKLIADYEGPDSRIRFFEETKPNKKHATFYARVDSNKIQTYYSYFPEKIIKNSKLYKGESFEFVFDKSPEYKLSEIDKFVFNKSDYLIDSLNRKNLKKGANATGFSRYMK